MEFVADLSSQPWDRIYSCVIQANYASLTKIHSFFPWSDLLTLFVRKTLLTERSIYILQFSAHTILMKLKKLNVSQRSGNMISNRLVETFITRNSPFHVRSLASSFQMAWTWRRQRRRNLVVINVPANILGLGVESLLGIV